GLRDHPRAPDPDPRRPAAALRGDQPARRPAAPSDLEDARSRRGTARGGRNPRPLQPDRRQDAHVLPQYRPPAGGERAGENIRTVEPRRHEGKNNCRGGVLPRPRAGQSPAPTNISFFVPSWFKVSFARPLHALLKQLPPDQHAPDLAGAG